MLAQTGPAQFAKDAAAQSGFKTIASTFLQFFKFIRFSLYVGIAYFVLMTLTKMVAMKTF